MATTQPIQIDTITSAQGNRIIELLENIELNQVEEFTIVQENFPVFYDVSRLILTYGFVYVPLIMVVIMLWWFFKQFLHKY